MREKSSSVHVARRFRWRCVVSSAICLQGVPFLARRNVSCASAYHPVDFAPNESFSAYGSVAQANQHVQRDRHTSTQAAEGY